MRVNKAAMDTERRSRMMQASHCRQLLASAIPRLFQESAISEEHAAISMENIQLFQQKVPEQPDAKEGQGN